MTRAASLLLRVVGLALVLVGLMGLVLVGVDGTWTARAEIPAGRTAVLLEPSVVSVLGPRVSVRVQPVEDTSSGQSTGPAELFLGRGRSDDLTAYAQDPEVTRVVGLDGSRELDVRDGPGPVAAPLGSGVPTVSAGAAASSPTAQWRPPTTVDLWQQQVSGPDARELAWRPTRGAQSVLIAAEDATPLPALDVEVAWTDHGWLWIPSVVLVLGIVLIVAGFVIGGGLPEWAARQWLRPEGGLRARGFRRATSDEPALVAPDRARAPAQTPAPASAPTVPTPAPSPVSATPPAPAASAPPAASSPAASAVPSAEPSADVVPSTRRAARGRRRKQTVWDRARSRARAAVPAGTAAARSRRSPDDADGPGGEGDRS